VLLTSYDGKKESSSHVIKVTVIAKKTVM